MSWCVLRIPCLPYTCYPPLTRHVRASRRDRAQPRAWPQATRATRRRRAGAHRASQAWPASCHPEALRRWRDRRRAREAEAVEVLRALAQSACIGLAGRRRLLRPACQASHTCGLSTSQPCARAGHSTEGSKGSVESGGARRGGERRGEQRRLDSSGSAEGDAGACGAGARGRHGSLRDGRDGGLRTGRAYSGAQPARGAARDGHVLRGGAAELPHAPGDGEQAHVARWDGHIRWIWLRNWFLRVMTQRNRRDSQGSLTSLVSIYIPPSSTPRGSLYSGPPPLFGPLALLSLP